MGMFDLPANTEKVEDRVGGSFLVDTGVYQCNIDSAYFGISKGGAHFLHLSLKTPSNVTVNEDMYITNKQGSTTYPDKKNPKKQYPLPGWTMANKVAMLVLGISINELYELSEEKVLSVYDFNAKGMVDTKVPKVPVQLFGQPLGAAIERVRENKRKANPAGKYVNSAEVIEKNQFRQFFDPTTGLTLSEKEDPTINEPLYLVEWKEKFAGKTTDRVTEADPSLSSSAAPAADGAAPGGAPNPFAA